MKRKIKMIITAFAVCAISAMAAMSAGCSLTDKIKNKIEQSRCEHEWNDGEITKEATCTEVGELTKTCTLCEKVETEEIPLVAHTELTIEAVAATCTTDGLTDGVKCSVCDTIIVEQVKVPALGHLESKDTAVAATCTTSGKTKGSHCARCDVVITAQETIPATGHNLVTLEAVEPTCTTEGKTQGMWCDQCKTIYKAQETIAVISHVDGNADNVCDVCSLTKKAAAKEVDVVDGELVAGNWYRIYRPETDHVSFQLSNAPTVGESEGDWPYTQNLKLMASSSVDSCGGYVYGPGPMGYVLNEMECVLGDEYIDVYLEVGVYTIGTDNATAEITEESTISLGEYGSYIKRLDLEISWESE